MARFTVRRDAPDNGSSAAGTILLGLGLGAALGFLLGELAGPIASRVVSGRTKVSPEPTPMSDLVHSAQDALDDDVILHDCGLTVLAAGAGRIEIHGWVPDCRARARAAHLIGDAVRADAIINCLQVQGEDEDLDAEPEVADEQSA